MSLEPLPDELRKARLRERYEVLRVSLHTGVDAAQIKWRGSSYAEFWESLRACPALSGKSLPDPSDPKAWEQASEDFTRVYMRGELVVEEKYGKGFFKLVLHPLSFGDSNRLGRQFGFHRFFRLIIPAISSKVVPKLSRGGPYEDYYEQIVDWLAGTAHQLLGRTWSAFWMQDHAREKKTRYGKQQIKDSQRKDVVLFATESCHTEEEMRSLKSLGQSEECPATTTEAMLKWLVYFETREPNQTKRQKTEREEPQNIDQMYLKLWSRIKLGTSE